MEALVAVGLVGNVVQLADWLMTLARAANSINKNGVTNELPTIKESTQTVIEQSAALQARLKSSNATLSKEEQVCLYHWLTYLL